MSARDIVGQILRRPISPAEERVSFHDLEGWDSLKGVRMVLMIEGVIGRQVTEAEIETLQSISDIDHLLNCAG